MNTENVGNFTLCYEGAAGPRRDVRISPIFGAIPKGSTRFLIGKRGPSLDTAPPNPPSLVRADIGKHECHD